MTRSAGRRAARLLCALVLAAGCGGEHQGAGTPSGVRIPAAEVEVRDLQQRAVAQELGAGPAKQVLFGDLHVHTTFSADAFIMSLPVMGGSGAHPPADACDYARHCAALDFWSINDHAESLTPRHWRETRESIRQCAAVGAGAGGLDTVPFLGWEWSQVGSTADAHHGHKNVILRDIEEERVPARAIAAPRPEFRVAALPLVARVVLPLRHFSQRQRYFDYALYGEEIAATPLCLAGVDVRELPAGCHEVAADPGELFAKLEAWGFPSLVIPHGTTWGLMTPPRTSWDMQLEPGQHDASRQRLIEVYSGHGSSEEYRAWRGLERDASGVAVCPEPTPAHEACCWRAGEIIRSRCEDPLSAACERRVEQARAHHLAAGVGGRLVVPGSRVEDWLDCGQCRDCFLPAYDYRPAMSAQYALAIGRPGGDGDPGRLRLGFIGSSDSHQARAGNGFKELARQELTDAKGRAGPGDGDSGPAARSVPIDVDELTLQQRRWTERGGSMLVTGGLAAVHAEGRTRQAIWDALERRETYATSGDRILLWFELLNAPGGPVPMGGVVEGLDAAPQLRVRAVGALEQRPGCPPRVREALGPARTRYVCADECYHPSDRRRRVTRIEVVRIRPRLRADEPVESLIQDPWRVVDCPAAPEGCTVELDDPELLASGREAVYYARAIQEPTLAVNGAGLRCERDAAGGCLRVEPCYGDERTPRDDDCLAPVEERAWSSPIFVTPAVAARVPEARGPRRRVAARDRP